MTEIEIHFVLLEISGAVSDNFQFWIATTFALVVATYAAGEKLPTIFRGLLAVIYAMAAALFYLRYQTATDQVAYYAQLLDEMNSSLPAGKQGVETYLRKTVMVSGSLLAIVFLFAPRWSRTNESSKGET